ncbi:MBL fold metallo-hydrolase [Priestia endophytica]|jgi:glyoxylase-like metal-dependent hydrolase (beta-lactamase superfamily II)|uniref:MBL fold metallo-hydrolase n=1 Tax=Priestia endophytica TaxID=135735 RepID=A0AAX1Q2N6_9BACI|nr:MBL fold metallo-hydrolase [Priestia endophytica]KAB2496036.1 MBL fold metallo-hydrolase [Priestia endophytica]MBG9811560.1 metallo-beta-lactamase [Priestia endophytica]RAS71959.1 MBL fold metallo-hydrolase [Priestia endophytica]RAS89577.1 MBL fold metallo-hydrolase [Priestia endophytica]
MENELHGSSSTERFIPVTSVQSGEGIEVTPDLYSYTTQIVNVCFIGGRGDEFVLVDAGMPKSAQSIISEIENRFGSNARPKAILLTHAHFDHVGALLELLRHWDVPVYAHKAELPYLQGEKDYERPDQTVEGGMVVKMSPLFPTESINISSRVSPLHDDGSIPELPEWEWIHTPGHTEGHVSFFRKRDRALIVGDAFITTKQENLFDVITQKLEISGPPRYLTTDWKAAKKSVEHLASLHPEVAITGHGKPVEGKWLAEHLALLARDFDRIAIPDYGKYVDE